MATYDLPAVLNSAPAYFGIEPTLEYGSNPEDGQYIDEAEYWALQKALYGREPEAGWNYEYGSNSPGWNVSDALTSIDPGFGRWQNLMVEGRDPNTGAYVVRRKTGDKEGTRFAYIPQGDGTFRLSDPLGTVEWDTNQGLLEDPMVLAMILAAVTAGAGAAGAFGGAGSTAAGFGAGGELLWTPGAATAAGGAAAGGAAGGAAGWEAPGAFLGEDLAGAISAGATPIGSIGAEGVLAAGDTLLSDAMASFGATGAVPFGTSVANIGLGSTIANLLPGAGSVVSTIGDAITGGSVVDSIINGVIGGVGGAIIGDINENATDRLLADTTAAAAGYKQAGTDYAAGLRGMIPGLAGAYGYQPYDVNNGIAGTVVDPATGEISFRLNDPYEQLVRGQLGAAQGMLSELGSFDPNEMASRMYNERQALIAPQREQQQQGLLQQLYNKGGYGLSVNTPTQNGTMGLNPFVNSFAAANAQSDRQMAYDSWDQGQKYIDSLIGRQRGLVSDSMDIMAGGNSALSSAMSWGNTLNANTQNAADRIVGVQRDALGAERDAVQRYIETVLGAQNRATASDASARTSTVNGVVDGARNLPWTDIFRGIGGLFD